MSWDKITEYVDMEYSCQGDILFDEKFQDLQKEHDIMVYTEALKYYSIT